jgi:hypothetical protein
VRCAPVVRRLLEMLLRKAMECRSRDVTSQLLCLGSALWGNVDEVLVLIEHHDRRIPVPIGRTP